MRKSTTAMTMTLLRWSVESEWVGSWVSEERLPVKSTSIWKFFDNFFNDAHHHEDACESISKLSMVISENLHNHPQNLYCGDVWCLSIFRWSFPLSYFSPRLSSIELIKWALINILISHLLSLKDYLQIPPTRNCFKISTTTFKHESHSYSRI